MIKPSMLYVKHFHHLNSQESRICSRSMANLRNNIEGTKLVKSAKLQMLISRFEEIKMMEDETFGEFYS